MKAEYELEFVKILKDISDLPTEQANAAFRLVSEILTCVTCGDDDFCQEAKKLCDNGDTEALMMLLRRESRR